MARKDFQEYITTCKFSVTSTNDTSFTFEQGEYLEYNGQQLRYGGETYPMPRLRVALQSGWLAPAGQENASYTPKSAEINVRGATPQQEDTVSNGSTQIADEEKVVTQVTDHKELTEHQNQAYQGGPRAKKADASQELQNARGMQVQAESSEGQEIGVKFNTPSNQTTTLDGRSASRQSINSQIRQTEKRASNRQVPKANPNQTHTEGINFQNENVGERAAVGTDPQQARQGGSNPLDSQAKSVGRVGQEQTVQRRQAQQTGEPLVQEQVEPVVEEEQELDPKVKEGRYKIAQIVAETDLPEWDFDLHWKKKLDLLDEDKVSSNPQAIRAIYAAESKALKERIKRKYPQAFVK